MVPPATLPTISIVIPFRNAAAHLPACLAAIGRSDTKPFELILVDDASTDASRDIAARSGARLVTLAQRRGPAFARNRGAEKASGELLFFTDADVLCHRDTLEKVAQTFSHDPGLDAVIGSYDDDPPAQNFLSRYKNLTHHFVHQQGAEEASTFWTGCGAVRRSTFREFGGFDESYRRPSIEDIELGYRMRAAGRRIALRKDLLVAHAKAWNLRGLLRSDVLDRAIPWTVLQLRYGGLLNDLNVAAPQRAAAMLAWAVTASTCAGLVWPASWICAGVSGLALFSINREQYSFYRRRGGWSFALGCAGMHLLYYLYSTVAFGVGCALYLGRRGGASTTRGHEAGRAV